MFQISVKWVQESKNKDDWNVWEQQILQVDGLALGAVGQHILL
jgi:hypothetical protein